MLSLKSQQKNNGKLKQRIVSEKEKQTENNLEKIYKLNMKSNATFFAVQ